MTQYMHKVLLFYPSMTNGEESPTLYTALPLSVVTLASRLSEQGFDPEILDERITDYTPQQIREKLCGVLFVGISAITSYQIINGLRFAAVIRKIDPALLIVWGGWHASLMPRQTIAHRLVDVVVVGQGEEILPQIGWSIIQRKPLDSIPNILYKKAEGRVTHTRTQFFADFQMRGDIKRGYRCIELSRYIHPQWGHKRVVGYESSRGCPFSCGFCSIGSLFQGKWYGLPAEQVVQDITWLKENHSIDSVHFFDNNFFLDPVRARAIANGLIERGCSVAWDGTVVAQQFVRFSSGYIEQLKKSGVFRVIIGGESGDEEVLQRIDKRHTNDQILQAVRLCRDHGLLPSLSFMVGFPWNPQQDTERTIRLIEKIKDITQEAEILLFVFSPYLGTPLFETAKAFGMTFPNSLEGWANFTYDKANTPWITPKLTKYISRYLRFFGTKELSEGEEAFLTGFSSARR